MRESNCATTYYSAVQAGGIGELWPPQILADQLTLFQQGGMGEGEIMHIPFLLAPQPSPPRFSDLPTAL